MSSVTATASEDEGTLAAERRLGASRRATWLSHLVWLVPLFTTAALAAVFVPRFAIKGPSLVDDWFALTYARPAVHQLLHGHYDAAAVDYGGRYRPAYAILGYVQWVFGSRTSTTGPTIVGLVRLLFFAGVVSGMTILFLRGLATRPWQIAAASIVPALVIFTRGVSANFVRFGVAEPTAFAIIAVGLIATTLGLRGFLCPGRVGRVRPLALFAVGYLFYLSGVYMWEASLAVVLLLPGVYFWLAADVKMASRHLWRRAPVLATACLLLAPLGHVLSQTIPAAVGAGATTSSGGISRLLEPLATTLLGTLNATADPIWPLIIVGVTIAALRRAIARDPRAYLALGLLSGGLGAAYLSNFGTSGVALSRYYIPLLVAAAVTAAWLLTSLASGPRLVVTMSAIVVVAAGRGDVAVKYWIDLDRAGSEATALASDAYATGCPVYLAGFPAERRMGVARVLQSPAKRTLPGCSAARSPDLALVVMWPTATALPGCKGRRRMLAGGSGVELLSCLAFRGSFPTQDAPLDSRARVFRLVPPPSFVPAARLTSLAYVTKAMGVPVKGGGRRS